MGWFHSESDEAQAHAEVLLCLSSTLSLTDNTIEVDERPHKASVTHELLASGIAFEAAREYEKHVEKNGKPANHKAAVEILAALTGGLVDRIVETKGLDHIDKEKAKHQAKKRAEEKLAEAGEY